jgi:hypothetical protein
MNTITKTLYRGYSWYSFVLFGSLDGHEFGSKLYLRSNLFGEEKNGSK